MSAGNMLANHCTKAEEWVMEVAADLSIPQEKAYRIIRTVFHALRNSIPIDESFHLMAQLPLVWKGIYVDGWKPGTPQQRMKNMADYLQSVRAEDKNMAGYDFGNDEQATKTIMSVWKLLSNHVSTAELLQICNTLPTNISTSIKNNLKYITL